MSADVESLAAALEALAYKLEQEIRAPKLSVTGEYVAQLKAELELREKDIAGYAGRVREQRHHDVLCLVLKTQAELETRHDTLSENADACVSCAKRWADLAYPPPEDKP